MFKYFLSRLTMAVICTCAIVLIQNIFDIVEGQQLVAWKNQKKQIFIPQFNGMTRSISLFDKFCFYYCN